MNYATDRNCRLERASERANETGATLILVLFLLIAAFAFGAVAIDSGTLYRAQLQLQRSADAAVLAGLGFAILQPDVPTDANAARAVIEARAAEVAELNMSAGSVDYNGDTLTIVPVYDQNEQRLTVSVQADINLFLIDLVPFHLVGSGSTPNFIRLGAEAAARRAPANIALVLDYSDSMQCPSSGDCNCLQPTRTGTCADEAAGRGVSQKIDDLRVAVRNFLGFFDESRDRISLTLFNIAANLEVPVRRPPDVGFEPDNFAVIDEREPASNTNVCDGFLHAYQDMEQAGIAGNEEAVYVYFSDGAPTAGRFLLSSPVGIEQSPTPDFGEYDYLHYTVQWVDQDSSYPGPSTLIATGTLPMGFEETVLPPSAEVAGCHPAGGQFPQDQSMFAPMLQPCIHDLGFHLPGMPEERRAMDTEFLDWRKQYYHCAVELADFMRARGGMVYSIGLGAESVIDIDPYQDINASFSRKDVFLTRVANDYLEAIPVSIARRERQHPEFSYAHRRTYEQWREQANSRIGRYYPTPHADELDEIFEAIARRVLLRLLR